MTRSPHGTVRIGEYTYHKVVVTYEAEGVPELEQKALYYRSADDGIYCRDSTDPASPEFLEFPFPPTIGRKWVSNQDDPDQRVECQIEGLVDLNIRERTYQRCLKVSETGKSRSLVAYYAPGIGVVKLVGSGGGTLMELMLRPK